MKTLLEVISIIDTLYETTEVCNCVVVVDSNEDKEVVKEILNLKLYPTLLCKLCVCSMQDLERAPGEDDPTNYKTLVSNAQIIVACKSLILKYGFGFLNCHISQLHLTNYRYSLVVV